MNREEQLKRRIRVVEDFPSKGISFKDITTLIHDADGYELAIDAMAEAVKDLDFDYLIGPEARGFIFGGPLALRLKKGFIPVRKTGKLPYTTVSHSYDLEYGSDTVHVHADAVKPGDRVLIVDDLLATGGTAVAVAELVEKLGGHVAGFCALIELDFLGGRDRLAKYPIKTVVHYPR